MIGMVVATKLKLNFERVDIPEILCGVVIGFVALLAGASLALTTWILTK